MCLQLVTLAAIVMHTLSWKCGVTPEFERQTQTFSSQQSLLPALSRGSVLGPIRIAVYYTETSAFSPAMVTRLQSVILPSALQWFANVLSLPQFTEDWKLPQSTCNSISVPAVHRSPGLPSTDVVVYVSVVTDAGGDWISRGAPCAFDGADNRPIAGTVEFNSAVYASDLNTEIEIAVARHEIAHVLAFSTVSFERFRKRDGSAWGAVVKFATVRAAAVARMETTMVAEKARTVYACDTLAGMELEHKDNGLTSHWNKRIMFNDFMVSSLTPDPIYSSISLSLFHDSGWYTVDFSFSDTPTFGRSRGCGFFDQKCVVRGVPQFSDFCATSDAEMCANQYTKKAYCDLTTYSTALPTAFQYFSNPLVGGSDPTLEFCPYVRPFDNGDCTGRSKTATGAYRIYGEKMCENCRCFTGTYVESGVGAGASHSGCHEVMCNAGVASVKVGDSWVACPSSGGLVTSISGYDGYLTCPRYSDICGPTVCPNGCFGYGRCSNGVCVCLDGFSGLDCSMICHRTCKSCTGTASNQCVSCRSTNAVIVSGECVCSTGFFLDAAFACEACHSLCKDCTANLSSNCIACYTPSAFLSGTTCVCSPRYYLSPSLSQCSACDTLCRLCSGAGSNLCTSCFSPGVLTPPSGPGQCLCASGYGYIGEGGCVACHFSCKECAGGASNQCLGCKSGVLSAGGECVCGAAEFMNSTGICAACYTNCRTCSESATKCTSCDSATAELSSVSTCTCISSAYWNPMASRCVACHPACVTCNGDTANSCMSCAVHSALSSQSCVCDSSFVRSADLRSCLACHSSCLTCSGILSTQCLTCRLHATLLSAECHCDSGFYMKTEGSCDVCSQKCDTCEGQTENQCLTCKPGSNAIVFAGKCTCSPHNFLSADGAHCLECDPSCQSCSDIGSAGCLSCYPLGVLTPSPGPGTCSCTESFYYTPIAGCLACHSTCQECVGVLESQCSSCFSGAFLRGSAPSQCTCADGFLLTSKGLCVPCEPNCAKCAWTTSKCTACDEAVSVLVGETCECVAGAYRKLSGACGVCHESCAECSAGSMAGCLKCPPNALLSSSPGFCQCLSSFFLSLSSRSCSPCHQSCLECFDSTANSCTLCAPPAILTESNSCECPLGYYLDSSSCQKCDQTCRSCSGPSSSECSSCYSQAKLSTATPSACECVYPLIPQPSSATCGLVNCHPTCGSCSDPGAHKCSSCLSNAVAKLASFPSSCECMTGFYARPDAANCERCDSSCGGCSGGSQWECVSCPSGKVLVEGKYCADACPLGSESVNGVCIRAVTSSDAVFRLQLDRTTPTEAVSNRTVQSGSSPSADASDPIPIYHQGWLFDNSFLLLPPHSSEPAKGLPLGASHAIEAWIRPSNHSDFGCVVSKHMTDAHGWSLILRMCVTDTFQLLLEFATVNLRDAAAKGVKTVLGGQVRAMREWTSVGYQLVFTGAGITTVSLVVNAKQVATASYPGWMFIDSAEGVNSVKFVVGAAYAAQVLSDFFKGQIAEMSIYPSAVRATSQPCPCAFCSTSGLCLVPCYSTEFLSASSQCTACPSSCSTGCLRPTDCRLNIDPLCAVFSSFEVCAACGVKAEMTSRVCRCVENAVQEDAGCKCAKGFDWSGTRCVQCRPYFDGSQVEAYFDPSFLKVVVKFAKTLDTTPLSSCNAFQPETLQKFGTGFSCRWSQQSVEVHLGSNSTLANEKLSLSPLNLYSSQGNCSYAAFPLEPIAAYKAPPPSVAAKLNTPQTFSTQCSYAATLDLDAASSLGAKNREMTFLWSITSAPQLPSLSLYRSVKTVEPILRIPKEALSNAVMTVRLTVKNFFGSQDSVSKSILITNDTAIQLALDGGDQIAMLAATKRTVRAVPQANCSKQNGALQYSWAFVRSIPPLAEPYFPFLLTPAPPNTITIPANSLRPGSNYTFNVTVSDDAASGAALFTLLASKSPLIASIDRSNCDFGLGKDLIISGVRSKDPDNTEDPLRFAWTCLEGSNPCIDSTGQVVLRNEDSAVLSIPSSKLKESASWNITLTVSKDTRSASKSVRVTFTRNSAADFTQKVAIPDRVSPQTDLKIVLQISAASNTSFQWTQSAGPSLLALTPLTSPYLLIDSSLMQSGYTYGFSLVATNGDSQSSVQVYFAANTPPNGGSVSISPVSGIALRTVFEQMASNWEDLEGDYPLTYQLSLSSQGQLMSMSRRSLSPVRLLKAYTGIQGFVVSICDSINTCQSAALPTVVVSAPQRALQSIDVLQAFQSEVIDTDRTFEMVVAFANVYDFDNATFSGVVAALHTYVHQSAELDSSDIDSCFACLKALFRQKRQMNSATLEFLLSLAEAAVSRYPSRLTVAQLSYLATVLGAYPGSSQEERTRLQQFTSQLRVEAMTNALPGQAAANFSNSAMAFYSQRMATSRLSGLRVLAGKTEVLFPANLSVSASEVVDLTVDTLTLVNSTSDQVKVGLRTVGMFDGFEFIQNRSEVVVWTFSVPILVSLAVYKFDPNATYQCVYRTTDGQWASEGMNLTSMNGTSATCSATHLSAFQVLQRVSTGLTSSPYAAHSTDEASCSTNFAPISIVSGLILFGFLLSLVLALGDKDQSEGKVRSAIKRQSTTAERTRIDLTEHSILQPEITSAPPKDMSESQLDPCPSPADAEGQSGLAADTLSIPVSAPSVYRVFLELHCVLGLCFVSPSVRRWTKVLRITAALAVEMAIVGSRYDRGSDSHSLAAIWTEYDIIDFKQAAIGLAAGFGVSVVLLVPVIVAGRTEGALRRGMEVLGAMMAGAVGLVAAGGCIYLNLQLCFEAGGLWAINFLPLFLGEIAVCQSVLGLVGALIFKLAD